MVAIKVPKKFSPGFLKLKRPSQCVFEQTTGNAAKYFHVLLITCYSNRLLKFKPMPLKVFFD